ncbi:MAG: hypothetical protein NT133_09600 [Alphaproteobacteria bacterium]|nr:hypothetical protein [Alphaproteobacteria bacterium]
MLLARLAALKPPPSATLGATLGATLTAYAARLGAPSEAMAAFMPGHTECAR